MGKGARLRTPGSAPRLSTLPAPGPALSTPRAAGPVRTCVGCRGRAARNDLVRVTGTPSEAAEVVATVDHAARAPGRGAWLHPDVHCLELAERRRAFGRALRSPGPVDLTAVRDWFETRDAHTAAGSIPGGAH